MAAKKALPSKKSSAKTLHNFFSPVDTQSPSKTPRKRPQTSSTKHKQPLQTIPTQHTVIVIEDSDDEDIRIAEAPKAKRRRLSESSEVEIVVDMDMAPSAKNESRNSKGKERETEVKNQAPEISFGKPAELLQPCPSPAAQGFGAPFLLVSKSEEDVEPDFELEFSAAEDWAEGDDEAAMIPGALEEDEVDAGNDFSSCPICEIDFKNIDGFDLQSHINGCLDASEPPASVLVEAGPSKTPETRISKQLHPITSLPIPTLPNSASTPAPSKDNAFSFLMASHKDNEVWKEADIAEEPRPNGKGKNARRQAPFYKVMQGMPIAVDAFKYGRIPAVTAYFLTHAHSDHYTNLSSSWKNGPIYCSHGTANLIMHMLKVDKQWVHPLPMDTPTVIPDTNGVTVTLIEANHCPGSCLFFFEGRQTVNAGDSTFKSPFIGSSRTFRYLHCGDFRASPRHVLHPSVVGKRIDHVYLDTTYLDPKYTFPPQPLVISACAEVAKRISTGQSIMKPTGMNAWAKSATVETSKSTAKDRILMVVGTYSIGKERIVKAMARALNSKVYCDARKTAILQCQDDPELHAMLTSDPLTAHIHLVPLGLITMDKMKEYHQKYKAHFNKIVGFRPTGWTFSPPAGTNQTPAIPALVASAQKNTFTYTNLRPSKQSTTTVQVIPVPYSEHSSFVELTCFSISVDWGKMIATVNVGTEKSRGKMNKWFQKWEEERKKHVKGFIVEHRAADYW